jgi:hypothetical protein
MQYHLDDLNVLHLPRMFYCATAVSATRMEDCVDPGLTFIRFEPMEGVFGAG